MLPAPDPDGQADELHMAFTASPVAVRTSLALMLGMPPLSALTEDDRGTAELVLAEVLNNVAEHAYTDRSGPVTVTITRTPRGLRCLIVDQGKGMPGGILPTGQLPTDAMDALESLPEGGFGWHLIRSLTSDLSYARIDGCNHLQFELT